VKLFTSFRFVFLAAFLASWLPTGAQTLGEALNATNLTWTTSGNALWAGQTATSHDGVSAARSGSITSANRSSILQTTVSGPGNLTFWWRHNPANGFTSDFIFKVDGLIQTNFSLYNVWQPFTNYLAEGTHTLQWVFTNLFSTASSGSAYVDEFNYTTGWTSSFVTEQPRSQSQVKGLDATLFVRASGTPPMSYQWRCNSTNIPGATSDSLIVTNVQSPNLGDYLVVVTNGGAASRVPSRHLNMVR
jgi:hypothetical protein